MGPFKMPDLWIIVSCQSDQREQRTSVVYVNCASDTILSHYSRELISFSVEVLDACLFSFSFFFFFLRGVMWVLDLSKFEASGPYEPVCQWVSQVSQCRDHYHLPSSPFSSYSIPHFLFWSLLLSSPLPLYFLNAATFSDKIQTMFTRN